MNTLTICSYWSIYLTYCKYNSFSTVYLSNSFLSELEFITAYFHVLWLLEFVFQSRDELGVDLHKELSYLGDGILQITLFVSGEFLHVFTPAVDLLELLAW